MKKVQYNRHNMHVSIKSVLDKNASKLISIPGYLALKDKLDNSIAKELTLENDQYVHKTFTAASKNHVRNKVGEYTLDLASKVSAVALFAGNVSLLERAKLTATYVKRISDHQLDVTIENMLTYAGENLEALAGYEVTVETLAVGNALHEAFTAERLQLARIKNDLKVITQLVEEQLRATLAIIHFVDALIETRRVKDLELYSLYWTARAKQNSACTKVSVKGTAFDSDTDKPLQGAILTAVRSEATGAQTPAGKPVRKIRIRSSNGRFQFKLLSTGAYLFKVTYAGYNDKETIVYINEGVLTQVKLPLSKIA